MAWQDKTHLDIEYEKLKNDDATKALLGDFDAKIDRNAWKCNLCANEIDRFAQKRLGMRYCKRCGRPLTDEAWYELEKRLRG